MSVKVSIIVPVYKVEKYIERCVNSLLSQTLHDIEIILVDDGSPDNCPILCDKYAVQDSRVKVIHKQNAGLGFARNSGLKIAHGEFIAFCDSDDYVDNKAYERLYNAAKQHNASVVYGSFYKETSPGIWKEHRTVAKEEILVGDEIKSYLLDMIACAPYVKQERLHDMSSCMSIYSNRLIDNYGILFTSERLNASEDTIFNIDVLRHANKIVILPYSFYYYCLNSSSLTQTFLPEKFNRFIVLRKQMIAHLGDWDADHTRCNRFYIGFARSFIICCFNSKRSDIRRIMKEIIDNPIWCQLRREYKPCYLPIYARILYWLTLQRHLNLLMFSGWIMAKLWTLRNRIK